MAKLFCISHFIGPVIKHTAHVGIKGMFVILS